ncbi:MAG: peptidoglycan editing factor PgeF [bacterium]
MNSNNEQLTVISYQLLNQYNEIAHFCTCRQGGVSVGNYASFNLSPFSGDDATSFAHNKQKLCHHLGVDADKLIIPYQTHGTVIQEIDETFINLKSDEQSKYLNGVDALFTQLSGICIGVTTADCVPILFFDPIKKVIAVAHAGWRGTCARIAEMTVQTLVEKYQSKPEDILVVIGPSISPDVYEVGKEVVENFEMAGFDISEIVTDRNNVSYLDLWKANQQSLERVGVLKNHIEISGICTFSQHEQFFSARRLGIKSGRMLSGIIMKNGLIC